MALYDVLRFCFVFLFSLIIEMGEGVMLERSWWVSEMFFFMKGRMLQAFSEGG